MLGSLLFSLSTVSVSALPGFARKARQVEAPVCPPASTITSYVPIITTIPECQGNLCSINTIISQGQPYITSSLTGMTTTGSSGLIIGGTTFINNGAAPTNAVYSTFTSCSSQCNVAGVTYGPGDIYYSTSTPVAPSSTSVLGGQTLQDTSATFITPTAVTSTFYSTTIDGVSVTDGSVPLSTTFSGADGIPTTLIQPVSQVIVPTPDVAPGQTVSRTSTLITPSSPTPATVTMSMGVSIGDNGELTTVVLPGSGASVITTGINGLGTPVNNAPGLETFPTTTGADGLPTPITSPATGAGAGTGPGLSEVTTGIDGLPTPVDSTPGSDTLPVTIGADGLPTPITYPATATGAGTGPGLNEVTTGTDGLPTPVNTSGSVALPVTTGADGLPTPVTLPGIATTGTTASIDGSATTTGSSKATISSSPLTTAPSSNGNGVSVTDGLSSSLLTSPTAVASADSPLSSTNAIESTPIAIGGSTSSSAGSSSTTTTIPCRSNADCTIVGLNVCLDLTGAPLALNAALGICGSDPTSGQQTSTVGASAVTTSASGVTNSAAVTSSAAPVPCTSNQECTTAGLGACLDILGAQIGTNVELATGTCAQISPIGQSTTTSGASPSAPATTAVACTSSDDCSTLGLGLCLDILGLVIDVGTGVCTERLPIADPIAQNTVSSLPTYSMTSSVLISQPTTPAVVAASDLLAQASTAAGEVSSFVSGIIHGATATSMGGLAAPTSVSCQNSAQCSGLGLGLCVKLPGVLSTDLGLCALGLNIGSSALPTLSLGASNTVSSPSSTATAVSCSSDADCAGQGLELCVAVDALNLAGAKVCATVDTTSPNSSQVTTGPAASVSNAQVTIPISVGVGASQTRSASAPTGTTTAMTCKSDADCSLRGLGVCLRLDVIGTDVGVCANIDLNGTGTVVGVGVGASAGSEAIVSASFGLGTGSGVTPRTQTAPAPTGTPTATTCKTDADCALRGLGVCLGLDVVGIDVGVCTDIALSGNGPVVGVGAGVSAGTEAIVSATIALSANNGATIQTQTAPAPTSTSTATSCRSDADCATRGLGVCLGVQIVGIDVGVCAGVDASGQGTLVGVGASVDAGTVAIVSATIDIGAGSGVDATTRTAAASTATTTGIPCASDAECLSQGLGACLGLDVIGTDIGVCAGVNLSGIDLVIATTTTPVLPSSTNSGASQFTAAVDAGVNVSVNGPSISASIGVPVVTPISIAPVSVPGPVIGATLAVGAGSGASPTLSVPQAAGTTSAAAPVVAGTTLSTVVVPAGSSTNAAAPAATTTALPAAYGKTCSQALDCGVNSGLLCIRANLAVASVGICLFG
ncbi:protein of unknown function [Taphrina deformans PYCC 5710]|uniref:Uncharacterized protein n=1 Tax=Taphrina deformans (strain PYCC 5710 / ATCC 11124 / CBS 356.35 / IMI 108563 / JCM 9778 / NBRC 8474) TaxID=1097556 RepID=R4XAJ4_TAPDE|nr:protein of unknown function [Taphrina deformans PYCC 5710]|eukprot:CCG82849.1 protein of unknown function [Taphrina deformans PYCC 5710]